MEDKRTVFVGVDIGSTTVKFVVEKQGEIVYKHYGKHFSKIKETLLTEWENLRGVIADDEIKITFTGSGSMGISESSGWDFVQEVYATCETVRTFESGVKTVIELGGEDAKIIFFNGGNIDERMNGTCAGGTGAFIEQMASLMNMSVPELDETAENHKQIYPIASRCGVFAKTDIQPLLNEGADFADIAQSIFEAVAGQTVTGLAHGQKILPKVCFLGGPLTYCGGLRKAFKRLLNLSDDDCFLPDYSLIAAAYGAMICARKTQKTYSYADVENGIKGLFVARENKDGIPPLFKNEREYETFIKNHRSDGEIMANADNYSGDAYLGVDCGSTTTKIVLTTEDGKILYAYYSSNKGNPVAVVKAKLKEIYQKFGDKIVIRASAATGYGEELVKNAFSFDYGIVETFAHFTAARHFCPQVDFIMDIGGQDIKCFRIKNGAIDGITLNEACSSGCGSFIETFAKSLGYDNVNDFNRKGLLAENPCDLGSRCTVFMNSLVKQAQRDGATVGDISAGLSISVVKNVLYKVLRVSGADALEKHIVVQGGTFLNDSVLRAFEREIKRTVIRPETAGIMGAYGCALYSAAHKKPKSAVISEEELENFTHISKAAACGGCGNKCKLTVNFFGDGKKFVSGNQCEKGAGRLDNPAGLYNLYEYKRKKIAALDSNIGGKRGKVGLPLCLGNYDLIAFWNALFTSLDFETVVSGQSDKEIYLKGIKTIPSDTVCYDAKLMHGHIVSLAEKGVDYIFYPSLTYNVKESGTVNHYNCPVVAYYGETLNANMKGETGNSKLLYPYLNVNDERELVKELTAYFGKYFAVKKGEIKRAVKSAYSAYNAWRDDIKAQGLAAIKDAREKGSLILALVGRPYHIDKEVCHNVDKLANKLGFTVVSEDAIPSPAVAPDLKVLNQWTYHNRMYNTAQFCVQNKDVALVQLVSFGCGIDAVTGDEIRRILEKSDKLYTQLKIDETTNLGAIKIRLRSLLCALGEKDGKI